jgi:putative phage-type endonuclease
MLTKEQLQARRQGIGASEAAAAMGLNAWHSPLEVYMEKKGLIEPKEFGIDSRPYWGNMLEDDVADAYEDYTGYKVRRVTATLKHPKYPWMLCHLDRKVIGQRKLLECKAAHYENRHSWGPSGTDELPEMYLIQVQHQLAVTGYPEADLAVLIGGFDFRLYHITRDEWVIDKIITELSFFWHNHVLANNPPPAIHRQDVTLLYPRDDGALIDANDEIVDTVQTLKEIKENIRTLDQKRLRLETTLADYINTASGVRHEDQILATWKADKNGTRVLRLSNK